MLFIIINYIHDNILKTAVHKGNYYKFCYDFKYCVNKSEEQIK